MRHQVAGKKLNRDTDHRRALRRNLIGELIKHEEIITTEAKARAIRGEAEKLITKAKRALADGDVAKGVHARRIVLARLGNNREATLKIFDTLAPRFQTRPGGYTRMFKVGNRQGDNAPMVMLQLLREGE
jgi:large subunit ribosomal protein L17